MEQALKLPGLALLMAVAALIALAATTGARPAPNLEIPLAADEVREVVSRFKTALQGGDSTAVVRLLHPNARIYEGGHAETRAEYRSGHLRGDIAFLQAVQSETTWDQVVPGDDVALYMSEYHTTGRYRDREIDSSGTETIVLVLTDEGWRIRHIHWSSR